MTLADKTKARVAEKLAELAARHAEVERLLADPDVAGNVPRVSALAREFGRLGKFATMHEHLAAAIEDARDAQETLDEADEDEELQQLARDELNEARQRQAELLDEALAQLVADSAAADRNVIVEIRAGTGGEEASLFASELLRMYTRYAERQGWKVELMDESRTDLGGVREVVISISGAGAWRRLRYESGGHRVQRVPETESQGRTHTSLATVAVLPEARDVEVEINPEDVEMSFMRSSGPGGQHVNKTSSCVRLVHKPTGITVRCQDEKSQQANRKKAVKLLRAKILERQERQAHQQRDALRRSQVGSGDRSERVRTYNFPQDRVTDHRAGVDVFGIESFMMGDCDRLFDALAEHDRRQRIKAFVEDADRGAAT